MKQFTVLLMLHLSISLFGQDSLALRPKKNSVQFELFGNGGLYSINYERIFVKEASFQICARTGLTVTPPTVDSYSWIGFIGELNFLIGKKKTFFEIGSGFTWLYELHNYHLEALNETRDMLVYVPRIGFRFKTSDKAFINFVRIGFTPLISHAFAREFNPFGGIAIGHSF